ncbi:DUF664 domain-containing protein [Amycolatopsis carbonis]|uniref:mycothiol transferase n=1 Tax=Amycolatopsis carbonis TaxID=715471 RepID=UPI00333ED4D0
MRHLSAADTDRGTNLWGLIKHVAGCELRYFGDTFGRPFGEPLPWFGDDEELNADVWATADESRDDIAELYRRAWAHSHTTITTLALDATGRVPHWPDDRSEVTLQHGARRSGEVDDLSKPAGAGAAGSRRSRALLRPADSFVRHDVQPTDENSWLLAEAPERESAGVVGISAAGDSAVLSYLCVAPEYRGRRPGGQLVVPPWPSGRRGRMTSTC